MSFVADASSSPETQEKSTCQCAERALAGRINPYEEGGALPAIVCDRCGSQGGSELLQIHMTDQTPTIRFPHPSRATRPIPLRSKGSLRGALVAQLPADRHPRNIVFESKLEERFLFLTLARRDVHDIWDQPPAVAYRDAAGKRRTHTFDFRIVFMSGLTAAIAIKPLARVRKRDFVADLQCIRAHVSKSFARKVFLITDREINRWEAQNAARYHEFSRTPDPEADRVLADLLAALSGRHRIADLVGRIALDGRGYRAVFRAIYHGRLSAPRKKLVSHDTIVKVEAIQ